MNKKLIALAIAAVLGLAGCTKSPLEEQCDKVIENSATISKLIDQAVLEHKALNTVTTEKNLLKVYDLSEQNIKQLEFCQKELAK